MHKQEPRTGINIPPPKFRIIGIVLLVVWAAILLVTTGGAVIFSTWAAFMFIGLLMLAGSGTRTVSHKALLALFFAGVFCATIAYLVLTAISYIGIDYSSPLRPVAVAIIDGALMLAPLLFVLRRSGAGIWMVGATDLMLMAAACGTGYGFVEQSYIAHRMPSVQWLAYMPMSGIANTPRDGTWLLNSHGLLCALSGATLGLGLLFINHGKKAWILAVSGFVIAVLDHLFIGIVAHNWGSPIGALVGYGWLTLGLFFAAAVCAIAADAWIINKTMPDRIKPLQSDWGSQLELRAVTFGLFQRETKIESAKKKLDRSILAVMEALVTRYKALHPEFVVRRRSDDRPAEPTTPPAEKIS